MSVTHESNELVDSRDDWSVVRSFKYAIYAQEMGKLPQGVHNDRRQLDAGLGDCGGCTVISATAC